MERPWMEYGSEYDANANDAYTTSCATDFVESDWQLYRSGRDAIKALARIVGNKNATALLPALCCESMILPFTANGYRVEFYKLNDKLCGDESDVLGKLSEGAIFLYMRYFGIEPFSDGFLNSLRRSRSDVTIVEDRTHDILIEREGGFIPDVSVSSLRKWAALPDGGMLQTRLGLCFGSADRRFGDVRRKAMEKKSLYLKTWDSRLKQEFLAELNRASLMLDEDGEPVAMSEDYRQLLEHIDFRRLLKQRQDNCLKLKARLEPMHNGGKLRFLSAAPEKSTLYFPIIVDERDKLQALMAKQGIYCPVIWPEPEQAKGICQNSHYICEHMLAIPCDQRYSADDMEFIADTLIDILKGW